MVARRLNSEQAISLCNELVKRTLEGHIAWEVGHDDEYWFHASYNAYGYSIVSRDRDDVHPFDLRVWDSTGREEIMGTSSSSDDIEGDALLALEQLYRTAKGNALNAGSLFDTVLGDLKTDPKSSPYGDEEPF